MLEVASEVVRLRTGAARERGCREGRRSAHHLLCALTPGWALSLGSPRETLGQLIVNKPRTHLLRSETRLRRLRSAPPAAPSSTFSLRSVEQQADSTDNCVCIRARNSLKARRRRSA